LTIYLVLARSGEGRNDVVGVFASAEAAEAEASRLEGSDTSHAATYIVREFEVK
jgi:hypothetical protein